MNKVKNSFILKGLDIVSCLLKMRALRDRFSANERRIADFIIENSQLMRDYSSQQLASAVNVSQSSIVKFSQKLGYKGYPDLKMAINESVVIEQASHTASSANAPEQGLDSNSLSTVHTVIGEALSHFQTVNAQQDISDFCQQLVKANKIVILATSFGQPAAYNLVTILLNLGKFTRLLTSDLPQNLDVLQQLGKGDVLLIIEDSVFSNSLVSIIGSLNRQGVTNLLINRMGDSQLHGNTLQQIEWVVTEEHPSLVKCQAQVSLLSLIHSLELDLLEQFARN